MAEYELRVSNRAELTRLEDYKFDTFDGLDLFKDYLGSMEEFLDTKAKKLSATGVMDFTYVSFVNLRRKTFFLGLLAFFESRLTQFCRDQKEERGVHLSLNDLAGKGKLRGFSNEKLRGYISDTKTLISVPPEDEIFFNNGFCEEAVDTIQGILRSLLSQILA